MSSAHDILKKYWGYDAFRPLQEEIVDSVINKKDTLALLPTGGGKSICFQVPALMCEGTCLVISPLIALMKDQVENLLKRGIQATYLHSGMNRRQLNVELENMANGRYKLVYLSPERLGSELFINYIRETDVNFIAVDEAHCISQWGYDFRPDYLEIKQLRPVLPGIPVIALTASATHQVMADIQQELAMNNAQVFRKSFYRPNLSYVVLNEENKHERLLRVINRIAGSGIVYSRNRKSTRELAQFLQRSKVSADFYHAGLSNDERTMKQEAWTEGRTRIMVSTNAFGMGIDKPDVRLVVHFEAPDSIESYYQEAGRAGRDGNEAWCVLMVAPWDREEAFRRFELQYPPQKVVEQVYNSLCDYLQVAFHAGEGVSFDIQLEDFTEKFGLRLSTTSAALHLLERMGYLKVSEGVYIPAKMRIMVSKTELYDFQIKNKAYDPLIKAILRTYGGIFSFYTNVRIPKIAEQLQIPRVQVEKQLTFLASREIIDFIPAKDTPFVVFNVPRMVKLNFKTGFVEQSKQRSLDRLNEMFRYVEADQCRSNMIRAYFDEKVDEDCGKCDFCRRKEQNNRKKETFIKLAHRIREAVQSEETDIASLVEKAADYGLEGETVIRVVEDLLDRGWLETRDSGKLIWRKEEK